MLSDYGDFTSMLSRENKIHCVDKPFGKYVHCTCQHYYYRNPQRNFISILSPHSEDLIKVAMTTTFHSHSTNFHSNVLSILIEPFCVCAFSVHIVYSKVGGLRVDMQILTTSISYDFQQFL